MDETLVDVERQMLHSQAVRGDEIEQRRAVPLVLSLDWAQVVVRLQQLHNEGCTLVRLLEDDRGRVRIEPNE